MSSSTAAKTTASNAYDAVPYISYPYPQTAPENLQSIAYLFGVKTPNPAKARVLELGCAAGANLLPVAHRFPEATCVGVDYSEVQIAKAQAEAKALGLKNITFKTLSIQELDDSLGKFDYIVCHGVFSWVPEPVQDAILKACKKHLSVDGVAYVSYNTLPGWNMIKSIREMMLYHTERFENPAEKAAQARLLMKFVRDSMGEIQSPYAQVLDAEMQLLANQPDTYLVHDHLEENNHPIYFHEFMARANAKELQYVGDVQLSTMFLGNLPQASVEALATAGDIVRTEQYMDFISNRRFRSTLLCHKDRILRRDLNADIVQEMLLVSHFTTDAVLAQVDIAKTEKITFIAPTGMSLISNDPVWLAVMQVFAEQYGKPIALPVLVENVKARLKKANVTLKTEDPVALTQQIATDALRYVFIGGISLHLTDRDYSIRISDTPKAAALAQHQLKAQPHFVTNQRQEVVVLTPFERVLLGYLDGTQTHAALIEKMLPHFAKGELVMHEGEAKIEDEKVIRGKLPAVIPAVIEKFRNSALLA